jgi:DNA-binding transcriptional LysR family regulator
MTCQTTVGASRKLAISQPAVSNALKQMEAELGFRLFDRNGNRLVAREEARILFAASDTMFLFSEALDQTIEDLKENRLGHVRVCATPQLGHSIIPVAIRRFLASRPSVKVFCDVVDSHKVIENVEASAADFGMAIALEPELRNSVQMMKIASVNMVCIVPPDHQLAGYHVLTPVDLKPFPLIALATSARLSTPVRAAYRAAGVLFRPAIETRYSETACLLVGAGAGVAVVDPFSATAQARKNQIISIPFQPEIGVDAWAIFAKERPLSRLALALLDEAKRAVRAFLGRSASSARRGAGARPRAVR